MTAVKHILWWLIVNSLGGINRARILEVILNEPVNANEISKLLELEYKTTRYHLEVLEKNGIITSAGGSYGKTYFPSEWLDENREYFQQIWDKIGKKTQKEGE